MTTQNIPSNPNTSIRTKFAYRFIRALKKLNKNRSSASHATTREIISSRIKIAADASMASAVGSRRMWSRAILCKTIKNRALKKRNVHGTKKLRRAKRRENPKKVFGTELRKIVPGGESMDMWSLLDETAHYVKCLTTQGHEVLWGKILMFIVMYAANNGTIVPADDDACLATWGLEF
ncbi:hypothetical protein LguiB_000540 [Lonicera macranthoides]